MTLILLLTGSYMLGTVLTAPLIGNLFFKKNIRPEGSGNPGARNAGRLFGKKAFVATFLGDALKGVLAVGVAKWLGYGAAVELLALFAVFAGLFLLFYPFLKSFTMAGLSAIGVLPVIVLAFSYGIPTFGVAFLVTSLLLIAHREDLKQKETYAGKELRK